MLVSPEQTRADADAAQVRSSEAIDDRVRSVLDVTASVHRITVSNGRLLRFEHGLKTTKQQLFLCTRVTMLKQYRTFISGTCTCMWSWKIFSGISRLLNRAARFTIASASSTRPFDSNHGSDSGIVLNKHQNNVILGSSATYIQFDLLYQMRATARMLGSDTVNCRGRQSRRK